MGVINITPNSFSDGGELSSADKILTRLTQFGPIDAVDIGAESTAPMNQAISAEEEWERLKVILPVIRSLNITIGLDTYHVETISQMVRWWKDQGLTQQLIWNDVSGKFDDAVKDYLKEGDQFHYVFCHNLALTRESTIKHMDHVSENLDLPSYFAGKAQPRVIFDPCLGFSKSYEQNWWILENFHEVQKTVGHDRWLLGFSRKSFLRKKYDLTLERKEELDLIHVEEFKRLSKTWKGEVWLRTHRPELT